MYQSPGKPWQILQAETEEMFADQMEHVVLALEAISPRFKDRPDLRESSTSLNNLLRTEILNVRKQADRLRAAVVPLTVDDKVVGA